MGQIQNSISGLAEKVTLAKTGAALLQSDKEMQAIQAQDKANLYGDTEVKDAYMKSLAAEDKLQEAEGKANRVFDRYGVKHERDKTGDIGIISLSPDESKLSKNPISKKGQLNRIREAAYDVNYANSANTAALNEVNFKVGQYETFRKRAEVLSKKAKLDMPKSLSEDGMTDKEVAWASEYLKGGEK